MLIAYNSLILQGSLSSSLVYILQLDDNILRPSSFSGCRVQFVSDERICFCFFPLKNSKDGSMEIQTESQIALNQKCISNRECCISNLSYFFSKGRERRKWAMNDITFQDVNQKRRPPLATFKFPPPLSF